MVETIEELDLALYHLEMRRQFIEHLRVELLLEAAQNHSADTRKSWKIGDLVVEHIGFDKPRTEKLKLRARLRELVFALWTRINNNIGRSK